MKVKKLTITPGEFEIGDYIVRMGVVKAVGPQFRDHTPFAYEKANGDLVATMWSNIYEYDVEREVDKPDMIELNSIYGKKIVVTSEDSVEYVGIGVAVDMHSGEMTWAHLPADKLIDAIKAVKGLD